MGKNPFTNQRQVLLGMHSDVETWITECGRCTRRKTPNNQRASPVNTVPQRTVGISLHGLPDTESVDGRLPAHYGDNIPFYALLHGYSNQKPARKNNSRSILQPLYRA